MNAAAAATVTEAHRTLARRSLVGGARPDAVEGVAQYLANQEALRALDAGLTSRERTQRQAISALGSEDAARAAMPHLFA